MWRTLALCAALFIAAAVATSKTAAINEGEPVRVPITLSIGLLGFEGGAGPKLAATDLKAMLEANLPGHQPSCIETAELLNVVYDLNYVVTNLDSALLQRYEAAVGQNLQSGAACVSDNSADDVESFKVAAESVESVVSDAYRALTNNGASYAILYINPNKANIRSRGSDFVYYFTYMGRGQSQAWISRDRYIVVDLAAGPCQFGNFEHGEGTTSHTTFPRPVTGTHTEEMLFRANIVSTVTSAVRHVFVPDVLWETEPFADKVLVPIIVFRNHNTFNPFDKTDDTHYIDIDAIKEQVEHMVLPSQQVVVVTGTHSLHEHKHISLAFAKALRFDSLHEMDPIGRFLPRSKKYIDSDVLLLELKDSGDMLAAGLIESSPIGKMFYNAELGSASKNKGTRVVPVFVFSLAEADVELMLDLEKLVSDDEEVVVVLQTDHSTLAVPFFSGGDSITVDPRNPTQHIVSGLAQALGNVASPLTRYSPLHKAVRRDYTWAVGHHPFGPFAASTQLSQVFIDLVLRNAIVTHISSAIDVVRETVEEVEEFAEEFLYDPSQGSINHGVAEDGEDDNVELWIDKLYHYRYSARLVGQPLAKSTVSRLHDDLKRMEAQFEKAATYLQQGQYDQAALLARSVHDQATAFKNYAHEDLQLARVDMFCCSITHDTVHETPTSIYFMLVGAAVSVTLVILFLSRPAVKARRRH